MFTRSTDASKFELVHGVELLRSHATQIIDCQVASAHTRSLGAVEMPRTEFLSLIADLCDESAGPPTWRSAR